MNILQFTKGYAPMTGGIETVVFELSRGLPAHGVELNMLCADTGCRTRCERTAKSLCERLTDAGTARAAVFRWDHAADLPHPKLRALCLSQGSDGPA